MLHDVLPPNNSNDNPHKEGGERKSIRQITLDDVRPHKRTPQTMESVELRTHLATPPQAPAMTEKRESSENLKPLEYTNNRKKKPLAKWVAVFAALAVVVFGVSSAFASAKVVVTPKQQTLALDSTLVAKKEAASGELPFQVMSLSKEAGESVAASGETNVERKASGRIVIYNNYGSEPQLLRATTRFETADGLIYRIPQEVRVPGVTTVDGKTVPGSIEVTVQADAVGEKYNIGLVDFTIPGFKSDPTRYEKFYARSKTPMSGGFKGLMKTAKPEDVAAARERLQKLLREEVLKEAATQKPAGYVLYNDAVFTEFEALPDVAKDEGLEVRERVNVYGILFDRAELSTHLAKNNIANVAQTDTFDVANLEDLDFAITDKDTTKPWETGTVSVKLSGKAQLVWTFDEGRLQEELKGTSKKEAPALFAQYPSIQKADVILRPFWKRTFPSTAEEIKIQKIINN